MIFHKILAVSLLLAAVAISAKTVPRSNVRDEEAIFGLNLLNEIEVENGGIQATKNMIIAPNGVRSLLAMLAAGADGTTLEEIKLAIGASALERPFSPSTDYAQSLNLLAIQERYPGDFPFRKEYLDTIQNKFNADLHKENFHTYVNIWATADINQWVNVSTRTNITNFFADYFPILTKMVAVNANYLKATWYWPMVNSETTPAPWQMPNGQVKQVETMNMFGYMNYSQFEDGQMIQIPFRDQNLNFYAFLPDAKKLAASTSLCELFGNIPLETRLSQLSGIYTYLTLPRYTPNIPKGPISGHSIKEQLNALGINSAFMEGSADFSGIDGRRDLHLNDFLNAVSLSWDETSAQGEAGSGGDMWVPPNSRIVSENGDIGAGGGIYPTPASINLNLNSAFLFFIQDTRNAAVPVNLFTGVIHDPEA